MSTGAPTFDLQAHSLFSDGQWGPAEVVEAAAQAGVELLALTDHDTVGGIDLALEAAEASGGRIRVVPATELSSIDEEHADLHILGYGIDHRDPALERHLRAWREDRSERVTRMEEKLRDLGWKIDRAPLDDIRDKGKPVGRPHLAASVFFHPGNAERLRAEGLDGDPSQVLVAYLIPGTPAFALRRTPTVGEAIRAIHDAGGVAVWAHPFWDVDDPDEVVATLIRFQERFGIDGVEAFYRTHTEEQTRLLTRVAGERGLLTTGSADFHGPDNARFHGFRDFRLFGETPDLGPIVDMAFPRR